MYINKEITTAIVITLKIAFTKWSLRRMLVFVYPFCPRICVTKWVIIRIVDVRSRLSGFVICNRCIWVFYYSLAPVIVSSEVAIAWKFYNIIYYLLSGLQLWYRHVYSFWGAKVCQLYVIRDLYVYKISQKFHPICLFKAYTLIDFIICSKRITKVQ